MIADRSHPGHTPHEVTHYLGVSGTGNESLDCNDPVPDVKTEIIDSDNVKITLEQIEELLRYTPIF